MWLSWPEPVSKNGGFTHAVGSATLSLLSFGKRMNPKQQFKEEEPFRRLSSKRIFLTDCPVYIYAVFNTALVAYEDFVSCVASHGVRLRDVGPTQPRQLEDLHISVSSWGPHRSINKYVTWNHERWVPKKWFLQSCVTVRHRWPKRLRFLNSFW